MTARRLISIINWLGIASAVTVLLWIGICWPETRLDWLSRKLHDTAAGVVPTLGTRGDHANAAQLLDFAQAVDILLLRVVAAYILLSIVFYAANLWTMRRPTRSGGEHG